MSQASVGRHRVFSENLNSSFTSGKCRSRLRLLWLTFLRSKEMYKHSCFFVFFMDNIDNSVISRLNPEEYLYLTSRWCKRYDDDHRGKSNTVRLTGKPAGTEGKRNPGVEQSQFLSRLHPLDLKKADVGVIPDRRVHVSEKQNKKSVLSQCGKRRLSTTLSSCGWLTANRRHPTCRCETTWRCRRWPDTFWWGWDEELAAGPLMCRAGETWGSLIHLSDPCSEDMCEDTFKSPILCSLSCSCFLHSTKIYRQHVLLPFFSVSLMPLFLNKKHTTCQKQNLKFQTCLRTCRCRSSPPGEPALVEVAW